MNRLHRTACLTAIALAISPVSSALAAAADTPLYASLSLFSVFSDDQDMDLNGSKIADIDLDTGIGFSGALGYQFSNFRAEMELAYRDNDVTITSSPVNNIGGNLDSLALMLNGYYDVKTHSRITPYIGAGVGMVDVDGIDTVFAYQGMVGASYSLNPTNDVFLGYRYFGADTVEDNVSTGKVGFDYDSHNIELGYRLHF